MLTMESTMTDDRKELKLARKLVLEGWEAAKEGWKAVNCPYKNGSNQHHYWMFGFERFFSRDDD